MFDVRRRGRERSGPTATLGRWHVHVGQGGEGGEQTVLHPQTWDRRGKETTKM